MSDTNPNPAPNDQDAPKVDDQQPKTFKQEDVDAIVSKRLGEQQAKTDKAIADAVKQATEEANRQAQLSAEEREKEERAKRDSEIADREQTLALRENRIEANELLQSKNIDTSLVDFVLDSDLDKTKTNIDMLEKAFTKAVESGVKAKLAGDAPEDYSGTNGGGSNGGGGDKKPKATGRIAF